MENFIENRPVVLLVIGTRPDTIKLILLYRALLKNNVKTLLCSTGQHAELLKDLLTLFQVKPDFDFQIMKPNQDLFDNTVSILEAAKKLFSQIKPTLVIVQGDTTTAMSAALAAFYLQIPIAHVEAGLRTKKIDQPFPEELNRRIITLISSFHFAPTQHAVAHLLSEGVKSQRIFCTGNTVVDALFFVQNQIAQKKLAVSEHVIQLIASLKNKKILLLTAHRRESFASGLLHIFGSIQKVLKKDKSLHVLYPIHPNPLVKKTLIETKLGHESQMHILSPLIYPDLVYVLNHVDAIATDSGGLQEEGVSLNIPVFVLREESDRPEGIEEGKAIIVGTDEKKIVSALSHITKRCSTSSPTFNSTYGNGQSSEEIAQIIKRHCL